MIEVKMGYLMMGLGFVVGFAASYGLGVYHGYRESFDDMAKARDRKALYDSLAKLRVDVDELRKGTREAQRSIRDSVGQLDGG